MLLTVKSIRIKRMNVEIFCERGVRKGARGVRGGAGAWGVVFGAFAGGKGRSQGRGGVGHYFWVVRKGVGRSQGARNACMIFSQQT